MKKSTIIIIAVVVVLVLGFIGSYNGLVSLKANVDEQYANISTQLQRRNDLIPNLVNTVKGYTSHENEAIDSVTEARAKLAGATTVEEAAAADAELTNALSRLLVVVENYPTLKADTQFTALQDELAGTENRIAVARKDYNGAVKKYNTKIKKFPTVLIANMFGFDEFSYFEAAAGAENVPEVNF